MKVLIVGGTGLISTAITRLLVERGDDVTLFNRGKSEVRTAAVARTILGDRKSFARFEQQIAEEGRFDCVIDMICFLPEEAESAVRAFQGRTGQYIFCSTVDVYTKPATCYPYLESEPLCGVSQYGRYKVACENIFMAAHRSGALPVTIIRPAYTYGEGQPLLNWCRRDTHLIDRLRRGKPIIVHGDGQSFWVCCHIDDEARAFTGATGNRAALGNAYHAAGEEWMTWNQYYERMAEAIGAPAPQLVHIPSDLLAKVAPTRGQTPVENFQFDNVFDNSAAHTDLGFRYTITWKEGVQRVASWLDERGMNESSDNDPFDDHVIAAWQRLSEGIVREVSRMDT